MYVLNEFFDKIYCINLDSRIDKWEECKKIFEHHNIVVERVSPITPNEQIEGLLSTEYSLILTTIHILKISKENGYKKILIFEDDVEFCDLVEGYSGPSLEDRFKNSIGYLPEDWNLFYLGCGIYTGQKSHIGGELFNVGFGHTTHSYGINHTFFDTCLQQLHEMKEPLDNIYVNIMREFGKTYSFSPNLISQRTTFSDIQEREVNYSGLRDYMSLNK
jgi:hypothetical protein